MIVGPGQGAFFIASRPSTRAAVDKLAADLGVSFEGVAAAPSGQTQKLRKLRIGLADRYGGSMPSGWTRFLLEQFEFPFEVVFPKTLDAGNLSSRFDVLIFPSDLVPTGEGRGAGSRHSCRGRSGGVPRSARLDYGGGHRAATEEIPRGRRNDCRRRALRRTRAPAGAAD